MKKTYIKPEMQVFEIERLVMLAGSVNATIDDNEDIDYGGNTSSGGINSMD